MNWVPVDNQNAGLAGDPASASASRPAAHAAGRRREPVDEAFIAPLIARSLTAVGHDMFAAAQAAAHALGFEASLGEVRQWLDRTPLAA